jgi:hypothetical protein
MDDIRLNKDDVMVLPFEEDLCSDCADAKVTSYVSLDMRGNGTEHEVFRGCEDCCEAFAARLRATLPDCEE